VTPERTAPAADPAARVRAVRARLGLGDIEIAAAAEIAGPGRTVFLQNQLPVDVASLKPGTGAYTAYLDRRGRITADLEILNLGGSLLVFARPDLLAALLTRLEEHRFRERVSLTDRRAELAVLEIHGPETPALLLDASGTRVALEPYLHQEIRLGGCAVRFVADPWTGDVGGRLLVARDDLAAVREALTAAGRDRGSVGIGAEALEILRIEGGRPAFGADMDERTLVLELGREDMVSHDKGCYLGQETVARVHSRGHVNRLLAGIEIEGNATPAPGTLLVRDEVPVGETRSACLSPSLGRAIALAMVRREAVEPGTVVHLEIGGTLVPATVRELPLYRPPGPAEQGRAFYRRGMEAFRADRFEEARGLFERALLMNPRHTDAFEAMGVSQERLGRLDDAIETMRALTGMDPEHVMGWTNLSRYCAQCGLIEEAEEIKGRVAALIWKRELGEREAERRAAEDAERRQAELLERIELFRRVLEMDPDDVIANFGLGKIYLDLKRYEEAVPCFRKAIAAQPDYSMALSHLGTALTKLGRSEEAAQVLREGIEVATRKGDLVPKRDMARKLAELGAPSTPE
jgi:folate-binding protein YgfZ